MPIFSDEYNISFHFRYVAYSASITVYSIGGDMARLAKILLGLCLLLTISSAVQAAEDGFKIRPGDVLQVTVWKEEGLDQELVVLPDGTVTFPLAGTVSLQGLTPAEAQARVKEQLASVVPDASVSVIVKSPLGHTISVMGQVAKPGDFVIGRQMTVMQALSQAGGLTPYASEGGIVVLRNSDGKKQSIPYPYDDITEGKHLERDLDLVPGDVVFVPTAGLF